MGFHVHLQQKNNEELECQSLGKTEQHMQIPT